MKNYTPYLSIKIEVRALPPIIAQLKKGKDTKEVAAEVQTAYDKLLSDKYRMYKLYYGTRVVPLTEDEVLPSGEYFDMIAKLEEYMENPERLTMVSYGIEAIN